jgi:trans-2,3-dihydro-3-hydroxyanthranilate isomerase
VSAPADAVTNSMKLDYSILDVFTDKPFAGNALAVVMKADRLTDDRMQAIAREFNLSETVFVHQPKLTTHNAALRIFTPTQELPFAGHPTVGSAVLLGLHLGVAAVRMEEKIGTVTCVMDRIDSRRGSAHFSLPALPKAVPGDPVDTQKAAGALRLSADDIGLGEYEICQYSAGVPYYLVPVKNAEALARIAIERRGWNEVFPQGNHAVYAFTETPDERGTHFAARMFAPSLGAAEDPATGSAVAALVGLLADHCGVENGKFDYVLRQGREMGRPSEISLRFTIENGQLVRGGIGGKAVIVAEGKLDVSD